MTIGEPTTNVDKRTYELIVTKLFEPDSANFPYGHVISVTLTYPVNGYTWASPEDWDDFAQTIVDGLTAAGLEVQAVRRDAADATITPTPGGFSLTMTPPTE